MGPRARPCRYNGLEPKTSSRVRGKNDSVAQAAARRLGLSLSRKVRLGRELRENSTLTAKTILASDSSGRPAVFYDWAAVLEPASGVAVPPWTASFRLIAS